MSGGGGGGGGEIDARNGEEELMVVKGFLKRRAKATAFQRLH